MDDITTWEGLLPGEREQLLSGSVEAREPHARITQDQWEHMSAAERERVLATGLTSDDVAALRQIAKA